MVSVLSFVVGFVYEGHPNEDLLILCYYYTCKKLMCIMRLEHYSPHIITKRTKGTA